MEVWKYALLIFIGYSSGVAIAGGVFAFITIIGIIPRLVQKTNTRKYIKLYESVIILGGTMGTLPLAFSLSIPIGVIGEIIIGLFAGIFIGSLAVCLAETIDVLPVLQRRARLKTGIRFFVLSFALGKSVGALIYFLVPGFIEFK